ncbi:MAG: peptidase C69 [Flavobacterium sp.]|nr:peptidase C69 [Flavobacterium sp.]
MKDLINKALNLAQLKGAAYADIRIVNKKRESITVKNQMPEAIEINQNHGFGVRVLYNGSWGFSASCFLDAKNIEKTVKQAIEIAKASLLVQNKKIKLAPIEKIIAQYQTKIEKDPFTIPLNQKLAILFNANSEARKSKGVKIAKAFMNFWKEEKTFASTEGSFIEQKIYESSAGIEATAISKNDVQIRSYPNSWRGQCGTGGYELIEAIKLKENAQRIGEEAIILLKAPQCPAGVNTLILDNNQLGLQIHESCGHPVELDRVLGMEASYAGTSFLTLEKLGKFKYGSDIVNITADATLPCGLGTFGYDDEGVPAQRFSIIKNGKFVNYLTSRETASVIGQKSNGTMRADGWSNIPLIRMTNINLEPGKWDLEDLIADTKSGIFMSTNKAWSIDDKRLNFQFGCEIAWEIKNGKLGKIYKNPIYTGITPQFWNSCDAICNKKHWKIWGTPNCGKGEPGQTAHVAHGCSPTRFRNVKIGVEKK